MKLGRDTRGMAFAIVIYSVTYVVFVWIVPNLLSVETVVSIGGEIQLLFHLVSSFLPGYYAGRSTTGRGFMFGMIVVGVGLMVMNGLQYWVFGVGFDHPMALTLSDLVVGGLAGHLGQSHKID